MSRTTYGCVEILYPGYECYTCARGVCRILFDSLVGVQAVLNHPWEEEEHGEDDDLPPPIVKPRGFPVDLLVAPSTMVLNQVAFYVVEDAKKAKLKGNSRAITPAEAKKLEQFTARGIKYYIDPEIKYPTWLTQSEVARAAKRCEKYTGKRCSELNAVAAMMAEYEKEKLASLPGSKLKNRPKTRLIVWCT